MAIRRHLPPARRRLNPAATPSVTPVSSDRAWALFVAAALLLGLRERRPETVIPAVAVAFVAPIGWNAVLRATHARHPGGRLIVLGALQRRAPARRVVAVAGVDRARRTSMAAYVLPGLPNDDSALQPHRSGTTTDPRPEAPRKRRHRR